MPRIHVEHEMGLGELAERRGARPVAGIRLQARELAAQHKLKTDPPDASPGGRSEITPKKLSESGGVIQPPPVQDRSVITPPPSADRMPTVPNVAPAPMGTPTGEAAERTTLQSLLVAAQAASERGEERQCLEGLEKARQLLRKTQ